MTSNDDLVQKNGDVGEKGDRGLPGYNSILNQPLFSIPIVIKSKNPNYFTFLKGVIKNPDSPYFKKQESELFPLAIHIAECDCYTILESSRDFPNRDLFCKHNNCFIKFERLT